MVENQRKPIVSNNAAFRISITLFSNHLKWNSSREVYYNYHYPPFAYHMKWNGPTVSTFLYLYVFCTCTFLCKHMYVFWVSGFCFRISLEFKRKDSRRNRGANWERTKNQNSKEAVITRVTKQFWEKNMVSSIFFFQNRKYGSFHGHF